MTLDCVFCRARRMYGSKVRGIDGGGYMHLSPEDATLRVTEDPDGDIFLMRVNYCPMCGRDLREAV